MRDGDLANAGEKIAAVQPVAGQDNLTPVINTRCRIGVAELVFVRRSIYRESCLVFVVHLLTFERF